MPLRLFICCACLFSLSFESALARAVSIEAVDEEVLRVCADPANMPFSNEKGEGFENDIAVLLAEWLDKELSYDFFPQAVGYIRNTLNKKKCDVLIGIPTGNNLVLNSNPYYRWGYSMVYLKDAGIVVDRPDHPQLAELRIGAVAGTPTEYVLHLHNLMGRVRPYKLVFDTRLHSIAHEMIIDLKNGFTDIVFMAAPLAAYYARLEGLEVEMIPIVSNERHDYGKVEFLMAMGVRLGENDWKRLINTFLREKKDDIKAILDKHGVPTRPLRPAR